MMKKTPPGDDIQEGGKGGTGGSRRPNPAQQQQLPRRPRFPPPPTWTPAHAQQHVGQTKVKLPPFWPKDPGSWFTLAESTFDRHNVVDSRLRFNLVLPVLPEEVIEQIRGVLRAVAHLEHPYVDLKARLLQLLTPKPANTCLKLIHGRELGDRRPTQLMETLLALMPPSSRHCT